MSTDFVVKGEHIPGIDFDKLTIGETRRLQEMTGYPLGELEAAGARGDVAVMAGLLSFAIQRQHPELTADEVRASVDRLHWDEVEFPDDEELVTDPPIRVVGDSGRPDSASASA